MNLDQIPVDQLQEIGVRFTGSEPRANDWALVLASAGIGHRLERTLGGWQLLVPVEDVGRASGTLDAYDRENPREVAPPPPAPVEHGESWAGAYLGLALIGVQMVLGRFGGAALSRGEATAELVLHGQPWRAVTALTLHADLGHLLGNVVALGLFATLVARRLGPGLAVALTLLSGTLGNLMNALAYQVGHRSIGASTAVFGAVGVLGGLQAVRGGASGRVPRWVPIAASLGLLAMLGSGDSDPFAHVFGFSGARPRQSDLFAHLFGLVAGVLLGAAAGWRLSRPPGWRVQWALLGASAMTVAAAWARALSGPAS